MSRITSTSLGTPLAMAALSIALFSCSAERYQPQVQGVENAEARLQLRTELATSLNRRIDQVSLAAEQLNQATNHLLNLFPNLRQQVNAQALKTFSVAVASLKNGLGADEKESFLRNAHLELDFLPQYDPCRSVDLLVVAQIREGQLSPEIQVRARTCSTDYNYIPFINLKSQSKSSQKFSVDMKAFETILGTAIAQVQIPPECEVEVSESFSLEFLKCAGIQIHQTKDLSLVLDSFEYDRRPKAAARPSLTLKAVVLPAKGACSGISVWLNQDNKLESSQSAFACPVGSQQ